MIVPDPAFLALQSAVAGRFSLEQELGRGGMGIVFLARDVLLERHVAIKLLAPALAARPEMRRRFLREARIAAQCFHPHIVPIHAVEEAGELAFFVMAYVRGESLAERLRRAGPLHADAVRRIGLEIGWALSYAHDRGVVHRDVKPENILMEEGTDRALIADFGIALHDDPHVTPAHGEVAGTARFMAPEQALGESIDGRADLYALGVTLFVTATGRLPYDASNALAIIAQQALAPAPSVRTSAPTLPSALADAIDRCLARDPEERFGNAAQFVSAIESEPVNPPLPAALEPARAGMRTARMLAGWSVVLAATTALLAAGESPLGRAILTAFGYSLVAFVAAAAALRAGEALLVARRAIRGGTDPAEVQRALAGDEPVACPGRSRFGGVVLMMGGAAIALAQGVLTSVDDMSDFILPLIQYATLLAPPLLIARGAGVTLGGSGMALAAYRRVSLPLARGLTRLLGGVPRNHKLALPESAPTEIMLDRAADAILGRLPAELRQSLRELPAAIASLASEARALRQRDAALALEERAFRAGNAADRPAALARMAAEREVVRARLGVTIAALETVRLDLLRLEGDAAVTAPGGGLTTHLEAVRELQRYADARRDVSALLADPSRLTPT